MARLLTIVFAALCAAMAVLDPVTAAVAREIPVYPGAKLVTEPEPEEEPMCCDFVTPAGFEKVVSFYEKALKTSGLEPRAFGVQYPHLKHHADALQKQIPPGMKIRLFPLSEMALQGQVGVETFEVTGSTAGVRFTIDRAQLPEKDRHFAEEWELAFGAGERHAKPGKARGVSPGILKAALPTRAPAGFTHDQTIAETVEGAAFAQASYQKQIRAAGGRGPDDAAEFAMIDVQINDVTGYPEEEKQRLIMPEEGGRKVTVKGRYPGRERSGRSGSECMGSEVVFLVNGRFQVEVRSSNVCDLPLFYQLIDTMNLAGLPR
jgi:hypothetical protein